MIATRTMVFQALAAVCAQACAVPAAPASNAPSDLRFELFASDARGQSLPLDRVTRRPEFVLSSTRPLASVELSLFEGEPDSDLLDDLSALPLRAANAGRRVPSLAIQSGSELRLAPRITLAKNATYTLALPGTARERDGAPLGDGGPAFLAQIQTDAAPQAGAAWLATLPAPEQSAVPVNLATVFVVLDGEVKAESGWEEALWLQEAGGNAVPAGIEQVDCASVEAKAEACLKLTPAGELKPGARYELRSGRALRDGRGAPVEPLEAKFETAAAPDREPPRFEQSACLADEKAAPFGCLAPGDTWVELRLRSDESVSVAAWANANAESGPEAGAPRAAQLVAAGEAALRLEDLEPDASFDLVLRATDLAGNSTAVRLKAATIAPLATLSITEVLADPEGADATREYVELWNFGDAAVPLQGITLSDPSGKESVVSTEAVLRPDERALLVADGFESRPQPSAASSATAQASRAMRPQSDGVPPGVRLIRAGESLTKSGIANAGEALYLRDQAGHRLSAAPARAVEQGRCLQRTSANPRSGAAEDFEQSKCTPGR